MSPVPLSELERELAHQFQRQHCIVLGSGTAALYCAFEMLRRRAQSTRVPAVLFPNITCETAVNAAVFADLEPRFCDVRSQDMLMCAESARAALHDRNIVAVVPTHIFGHLLDISALARDVASALPWIEDAAQAYGGRLGDRPAGALADAAIISFGAGKIVDCGGGGALLCDDDEHANAFREIASTLPADDSKAAGHRKEVMQKMLVARKSTRGDRAQLIDQQKRVLREHRDGYLSRCTPARAEAILGSLPRLEQTARARAQLTRRLDDALGRASDVRLPERAGQPALWRYTFTVAARRRSGVVEAFGAAGLAVSRLFPPCTDKFQAEASSLPTSEQLATELVNLQFPPDPAMHDQFFDTVRQVLTR